MQKCYNCGKEVDDSVLICPDCGALVKRYTAPTAQEAAPSAAPQSPYGQGGAPSPYPAQKTPPRGVLRAGEDGRLHLRGLVMAWIVICAVVAMYNAISFGCGLYLYQNQDMFLSLFAMYEGVDGQIGQMAELMRAMIAAIGRFWWLYVLFLLLYLVKGVGYIYFAAAKRRLALYLVFGASIATLILMLAIGNGLLSVWYVTDAIVTALIFRKSWNMLRK